MVRRLITRRGNDWTQRYPLVAEVVKVEFHVFKTPVGRGYTNGLYIRNLTKCVLQNRPPW